MRAALDATPKGNPPTAEDIANRLGIAWKDLADAPSSDASEERARRRRRRPKAR